MGEHGNAGTAHGGGGGEHHDGTLHDMHSIANGMTMLDVMHLMGEGGMSYGVPLAHATEHFAHEASLFGRGAPGAIAGTTATAIASPMAVVGGMLEMVAAFQDPNTERAAPTFLAGATTTASGGMGLAGLAGMEAAGAYAPVVGAGALGVKAGMYADEDVKNRGWLEDREGNDTSIHDWAAENGQAADEWVTEHTTGWLGTAAGLGVTGLSSIAGAGIALGDLAVNAGEALVGGPSLMDLMHMQQEQDEPSTIDMVQQFSARAAGQHTALSHPGGVSANPGALHSR